MAKHHHFYYWRERLTQLFCVGYYCYSASLFFADFQATQRATSAIALVFLVLVALFSLLRKFPKEVSGNPVAWAAAFLGTVMTASFIPAGTQSLMAAQSLQGIGLVLTSISLISLNQSFSIVAANRGIKTRGLYRLVRHPLYASYLVYDLGLLLSQFSRWNLFVALLIAALSVLRIRYEEALLMRDEAYQAYALNVRSRLIPGIW